MKRITDYRYMDEADIIVFNGGRDIGASIYNEKPIMGMVPAYPSHRDELEIEVFEQFAGKDVLLLGICRGAQLLNCLNGGTLWQDVNNHGRDHMMTVVKTGERMICTSTHHQMMRPAKNAKIIATANVATAKMADKVAWNVVTQPEPDDDIEIVWYENTGSLCIQGHPEYVPGSKFAKFCLELIHQHLQEVRNAA